MKQVLLVTATKAKTEEEFKKRPICKSIKKLYDMYTSETFDFTVIKDNKEGLSTVYNKYITDENSDKIVLFVHDDLIIDTLFLVEHLNKSPYTVTGLAGTKSLNLKADKTAWHLMADRKDFLGEVKHIKDGNIWTTVFGPTAGAVTVVDGLFIAVDVEKILKRGIRFNEEPDFAFHFYDITFCLDCINSSLSVGVLPINVIHYGLGDSMNTPEWEKANLKFKDTYCK